MHCHALQHKDETALSFQTAIDQQELHLFQSSLQCRTVQALRTTHLVPPIVNTSGRTTSLEPMLSIPYPSPHDVMTHHQPLLPLAAGLPSPTPDVAPAVALAEAAAVAPAVAPAEAAVEAVAVAPPSGRRSAGHTR